MKTGWTLCCVAFTLFVRVAVPRPIQTSCQDGDSDCRLDAEEYDDEGDGFFAVAMPLTADSRGPNADLLLQGPSVLGLVARQILEWSPASFWVGRPPVLGLVARQFLGGSPS